MMSGKNYLKAHMLVLEKSGAPLAREILQIFNERDEARKWARHYKRLYEQATCEHPRKDRTFRIKSLANWITWTEPLDEIFFKECRKCGKNLEE